MLSRTPSYSIHLSLGLAVLRFPSGFHSTILRGVCSLHQNLGQSRSLQVRLCVLQINENGHPSCCVHHSVFMLSFLETSSYKWKQKVALVELEWELFVFQYLNQNVRSVWLTISTFLSSSRPNSLTKIVSWYVFAMKSLFKVSLKTYNSDEV